MPSFSAIATMTPHSHHQPGYSYPFPDPPQQSYDVESVRWGTAPYSATPPIEPMHSAAWRGVYTPSPPAPDDHMYIHPEMTVAQPFPLNVYPHWMPTGILYPDGPAPFPRSPSFLPGIPNPTSQPMVHGGPSTSTNPPDYVSLPQRQYALTAHHFAPAPPILFDVDTGEPGITLSAALHRKFSHLKDRDDLVFELNKSPTITMRLEWPGYASWGRQVRVLDSRSVQQSISREKLAFEVAKTVFRFTQPENGKRPSPDFGAPDRERRWALEEGNIGLDDLVLVRVDNVSRGSWQPQFLVRRRHRA